MSRLFRSTVWNIAETRSGHVDGAPRTIVRARCAKRWKITRSGERR